jgi:hypothetical protein
MKNTITQRVPRFVLNLVASATVLFIATQAGAAEVDWPRDIEVPEATITIYQPQLESFKADKLTARAAISVTKKGETEPIFGAVWFAARVSTDHDTRTVTLLELDVPQVKFPNADPSKAEKLEAILENEIPKWNPTMSLDRLLTALELVEKEDAAAEDLRSVPPKIIFTTAPTVLVVLEGEPQLSKVENSDLMRVVNTPFFIVLDPKVKLYYLKGGNQWFVAPDISGPWQIKENPPASMVALAAGDLSTNVSNIQPSSDRVPQIIITTKPAELIVSDGEPKYTPISGTDLLYMSNTESDVFMHIGTQLHFVLLSGRWFSATSLDKSWSYVRADGLPRDFAKIPPGSAKGYVLAQVAGTQEAKEAVLETYVPQTAAVKRSEAKVAVSYDGAPKFVKIEDTDMYYATNTSYSVIRYGSKYYCCNDAVWFEANDPMGPWVICVAVPQAIYTIPPSCPVYHVKYVYVYSYTPVVVYVGYTPGYVGSYVYGGTVVYGTGYIYPAWHGVYYYPRPVTYGYAAVYRPYRGWGFAAGFATGWVASHARHRGWWGRGGYRDIDIDINRNINIDRSRNNVYNRRRDVARRPGTGRPGAGRPSAGRPGTTRPARANNVFADRNGNVHRRTDTGWQQRTRDGWSDRRPSTSPSTSRPSTRRPSSGRRSSNLDRHHNARQRGTSRTNNFQRSRGSGGRRGGFGGRRGGRRR